MNSIPFIPSDIRHWFKKERDGMCSRIQCQLASNGASMKKTSSSCSTEMYTAQSTLYLSIDWQLLTWLVLFPSLFLPLYLHIKIVQSLIYMQPTALNCDHSENSQFGLTSMQLAINFLFHTYFRTRKKLR